LPVVSCQFLLVTYERQLKTGIGSKLVRALVEMLSDWQLATDNWPDWQLATSN
jgi:hypothetical protein